MHVALQVIALTALLYLTQVCLRRAGKWAVWALFLAAPLVLTPYWFRVNEFGLFVWIKFYTIFLCVIWGTAVRLTTLGDRRWARYTIPLLLAGNILEATALDLIERGLAHNLNALAGLLLILTVPYGRGATTIETTNRDRDVLLGTSRAWVVGYTLWNWTFVYLNYPMWVGHHTAVLLAALIVGMIDPRRWIQARAFTLGSIFLVTATCNAGLVSWLDTSNWTDPLLGIVAARIALAFMVGYSGRALWLAARAAGVGGRVAGAVRHSVVPHRLICSASCGNA